MAKLRRFWPGWVALAIVVAAGAGALVVTSTHPGRQRAPAASRPAASPSPAASSSPLPGAVPSTGPPTPAPSPAGGPSGVAMPTGDIPGWTQVFADDFTGTTLDATKWGAYRGKPGGDPGGWWDPSHVVVADGVLNLETYRDPAIGNRWVSGGVSSARALQQTYGKYLVRFRVDKGNGVAYVALLWPTKSWPPEIDFVEDGGGDRSQTTATFHCGSYGNDSCQVQRSVAADFTQWHTLGVEWTATGLTYTLDGQVWATMTSPAPPSKKMELDLQTQAGTCGDRFVPCPDAGTPPQVDMQVDWVVAYKPA